MSTFEDRLLTELRQRVAANPAPPRRRGRLVLAGGGVVAAATAAVIVAVGGGASAYAVEKAGDGAVTVHIRSLSDAAGLQRELRAAGVPAIVRYGDDEHPCGAPPSAPTGEFGTNVGTDDSGPSTTEVGTPPAGGRKVVSTSSLARTDDGVVFTIDPGELQPGDHVYITTSTGSVDTVGMAVC
jgi:hypothetical protein